MPSKKSSYHEECPVCGGLIWGKGQKVLVEGIKITICQNCAEKAKKIINTPRTVPSRPPVKPKTIVKTKPRSRSSPPPDEPSIEIVSDFAKKIHHARMKKNLSQDKLAQQIQEKVSLIRRIEAGKIEPPLKIAGKLEKVLGIKLMRETTETPVDYRKFLKKSKGTSLGDIAFIKKKK
ncbi:MAG: multiprotein bridging factor aMBF1 [Promethearchaeota archaeon]